MAAEMKKSSHLAQGQDRRLFLRVRPEPHIPIRVDVNGKDFVDIFYAVDISVGGLGLKVPHRFEGCRTDLLVHCLLRLPTPFAHSVGAQGSVIHISGDRFGIAFHNLSEKAEKVIDAYVCHRLKQESWWSWAAHRAGLDTLSIRFLER